MDQKYPESTKEQSIRIGIIINANLKWDDLEQDVIKLTYLYRLQRLILLSCLKRYQYLFDCNLGEQTGPPVDITLKEDTIPTMHELSPLWSSV